MESFAHIRQALFESRSKAPDESDGVEGTIMIIDDDVDIIDALASLLKPYFRLLPCLSYEEAQRNLSMDIEVILLDMKMASRDGIEVFKLLRQERKEIQIIFHSAYPGSGERADTVARLSHSGYLTKGEYDLPELLTVIRTAMKHAKEANALGKT